MNLFDTPEFGRRFGRMQMSFFPEVAAGKNMV